MLLVAPLTWAAEDERPEADEDEEAEDAEPTRHTITLFGRLTDGRSVCVRLPWCPRFFVDAGKMLSPSAQAAFLDLFPKRHPVLSERVHSTGLYGFCAGRRTPFLRLAFPTLLDTNRAKWKVKHLGHRTFEGSVDTVSQFMHAAHIRPAEWLVLKKWAGVAPEARVSTCDRELTLASHTHITRAQEAAPAGPVPWSLASWDLETYSPTGQFPNPDDRDCPIIQIGVVLGQFQSRDRRRVVITTRPCGPVEGVEVVTTPSEAAAITAFCLLLARHQVDVLMAWNGYGFDNRYLFTRASMLDIEDSLPLGKLAGRGMAMVQKTIKGQQHLLLRAAGVVQLDPMLFLRAENRFERYSLNFVAEAVLGESKLDLPYHEMFALHAGGSPEGQARIAEYCAVDCDLALRVVERLALIPNILALANATRTPVEAVLTKGQVRPRPLPEPVLLVAVALPVQHVLRDVGRRQRERVPLVLAGLQDVPELGGVVGPEAEDVVHHRAHRVRPDLLVARVPRQECPHRVPDRRHERRRHELGVPDP